MISSAANAAACTIGGQASSPKCSLPSAGLLVLISLGNLGIPQRCQANEQLAGQIPRQRKQQGHAWIQRPRVTAVSRSVRRSCRIVTTASASSTGIA